MTPNGNVPFMIVCDVCGRTKIMDTGNQSSLIENANAAGFYCTEATIDKVEKTMSVSFSCKEHFKDAVRFN